MRVGVSVSISLAVCQSPVPPESRWPASFRPIAAGGVSDRMSRFFHSIYYNLWIEYGQEDRTRSFAVLAVYIENNSMGMCKVSSFTGH